MKAFNFKPSLWLGGKRTLNTLYFAAQLLDSLLVLAHVLVVLLLEYLHKVFHNTLIEIFSSKMGISVGSLYLEHTTFDGQQGYIKGTTTKIENEDVLLALLFFV
mmetsp:Transcript_22792/g.49589  ORF Transcript_22792/g.49589 Transcript_22792/m.49589 type:complete len:104 (-) Transcript_22792:666-977(-)